MALSSPNLWIKTKIDLHKSLLIAYFHTKLQTDGYFITCVESIRGPMNQHKNEVFEYKSNIWSSSILLSAGIDLNTFFANSFNQISTLTHHIDFCKLEARV